MTTSPQIASTPPVAPHPPRDTSEAEIDDYNPGQPPGPSYGTRMDWFARDPVKPWTWLDARCPTA